VTLRRARLYRRGAKVFLHALVPAPDGRFAGVGPFLRIDGDSPDSFLGETALQALGGSRAGARGADDPIAYRRQLVEMTGARTWSSFIGGTIVFEVEQDGEGVRIFATRARSFERAAVVASVATAAPIDVGAEIRRALSPKPKRKR
jgi:hypothetical protein